LKVESGASLEHHAALHTVAPTTNNDKRCHERQNLKLLLKSTRVPHFSVLGFKTLSTLI
jgi:hypothetical protein